METIYMERYKEIHLIQKETPTHQKPLPDLSGYESMIHNLSTQSINEICTGVMISMIKKNLSFSTFLRNH